MTVAITKGQVQRLQVLYSQYERHTLDATRGTREERLQWASQQTGRLISSFKDLTLDEAKGLIDALQRLLNVKAPSKRTRRREDARRAGIDGRRDGQEFKKEPRLASAEDLATIERFYLRLDWTRDRFDAWLCSPSSPLGKRSNPQIRTLADANSVRWGLKRLLQKAGIWYEDSKKRG
ncbi:hypothetical protein Acid345_3374 [Candidatus Koribacter versatilis Ellin345]|uniref:Uncharacterized protein n=1 Tax=Koribacter versatilis (strain Ellin345) TaxID=204669 RepID=Q1IL75_KORVE|nr:hypothetical protein [Candidatus Koribacter versatilis]ABF42375.1 hypothetical protein Acid345_3374 [Candidatus Koribacter versatilis Ellin345]